MSKHQGNILYRRKNVSVVDCQNCGFAHIIPYPKQDDITKEELNNLYGKYDTWVENSEEDKEWLDLCCATQYRNFLELLSIDQPKGQKLLDVGCGLGFFLDYGKKQGWDILGIEPGKQALEYCKNKGLNVIHGFLGQTNISAYQPFDVVHLAKVIEHMPDPAILIKNCYDVLKHDGLFCLTCPNDFNLFQLSLTRQGQPHYWVNTREHVNYFTYTSISNLLEKNGFKVVLKEASFPLEWFLLMGKDYLKDDSTGRECHHLRTAFELALEKNGLRELRSKLYRFFADQGIGRVATIYAKKRL